MQTTEYRLIELAEAVKLGIPAADGRPMVTDLPHLAAAIHHFPPVLFGDVNPSAAGPIRQDPPGWDKAADLQVGPFPTRLIRDARVHTRYGIVTSGPYLFRDTLYHVPVHLLAPMRAVGESAFVLPQLPSAGHYPRAVHLLAGNPDSYYHWLIDLIARVEPAQYGPDAADPGQATLLVPGHWRHLQPAPLAGFQEDSLALSLHEGAPRHWMGAVQTVQVDELRYAPNATIAGFAHHPGVLGVFDLIRERVLSGAPTVAPRRRVYLSRQGSEQRKMSNEAEVIELLSRAGFDIVCPERLSLAEQVALLDQATHIVAPHGAAFTNLLFCRPGTVVCELHMDGYVHWSMRCLAGIRGLRYGCLIGRTDQPWLDWPHANTWTVPLRRLAEVLQGPEFN